mmetsp:Transcript_78742/g.132111  ORF Transcript_78742/g.132111 Transcript_78742/m.132111 type:complete len:342 (-) Transcript_78742:1372-2397(-)
MLLLLLRLALPKDLIAELLPILLHFAQALLLSNPMFPCSSVLLSGGLEAFCHGLLLLLNLLLPQLLQQRALLLTARPLKVVQPLAFVLQPLITLLPSVRDQLLRLLHQPVLVLDDALVLLHRLLQMCGPLLIHNLREQGSGLVFGFLLLQLLLPIGLTLCGLLLHSLHLCLLQALLLQDFFLVHLTGLVDLLLLLLLLALLNHTLALQNGLTLNLQLLSQHCEVLRRQLRGLFGGDHRSDALVDHWLQFAVQQGQLAAQRVAVHLHISQSDRRCLMIDSHIDSWISRLGHLHQERLQFAKRVVRAQAAQLLHLHGIIHLADLLHHPHCSHLLQSLRIGPEL